jgi:hypothetical protein
MKVKRQPNNLYMLKQEKSEPFVFITEFGGHGWRIWHARDTSIFDRCDN